MYDGCVVMFSINHKMQRIFSELINLRLDVVFTHGPQLFVKLGRYFMGAEVFNSLEGGMKKGFISLQTKHAVSFPLRE